MSRTSAVKTNAVRLLESAGIVFSAHEYPVDDGLIDAKSIARKLGRTPDEVFKTLVAETPAHEYFVFVIPAAGELDLKKAAQAAQRKSIDMIPLKQLFPLICARTLCLFGSSTRNMVFGSSSFTTPSTLIKSLDTSQYLRSSFRYQNHVFEVG